MRRLAIVAGSLAFLVFLVVGLSIRLNLSKYRNNAICEKYAVFNDMIIRGFVIDKFRDEYDHMNEKINIDGEIIDISLDTSRFYDFIEIGDSINKESGYSNIFVFRSGEKIGSYKITFGCK